MKDHNKNILILVILTISYQYINEALSSQSLVSLKYVSLISFTKIKIKLYDCIPVFRDS